MNRKNVGIAFGALCGLAALTATAAEIFYDISINTKSPIHMSKLNNLVQKATNTDGNEEEASAKYSGMTGTPEIKEWYATHGDSEGTKIGMGWPERMDIIKWINRILSWEPNARIVLHGVSMGAATVLMASGEDLPENVKAVIADCGYTSEWDEFQREADTLHIPWFPVLNATSVLSKVRDGYDFKQASALAQVKKSRIPTLFIHGSSDELVPYSMLGELYAAAACEKEELTVECAGHALSSSVAPTLYWRTVEDFIAKYLDR